MEINTTINLDMDDLANELEDQIREIAEDQMNQNNMCFQDEDDVTAIVQAMIEDAPYLIEENIQDLIDESMQDIPDILDADDVQQLINESMMDVADNTDTVNEITTEYRDLRNEVEKLRRSMRVLLEERERSVKKRAGRAVDATTRAFSDMVRKFHWHMPRR